MPNPFVYRTDPNAAADSIGRLLLQRGEIEANRSTQVANAQARAAQASGEAWGGAVRDIGKTIGAIPGQIAEQKQQGMAMEAAQMQMDAARRKATAEKTVAALPFYASGEGRNAILSALDGDARELAMEHYQKADEADARLKQITAQTTAANLNADESKLKIGAAQLDVFGALASGVKAHGYDPSAFSMAVADAVGKGLMTLDQAGPMVAHAIQNPEWVKQATDEIIARSPEQQQLEEKRLQEQRLVDAAKTAAADKAADNTRADATAVEAARHNKAMENRPVAGAGNSDDAEAVADAIIRGEQPPELTSLYRDTVKVKAILGRKGYNQSEAITDWKATQKHLATANGAQQLRLNQSISALPELLDSVDALASKWKGGKFPPLNRASLIAAKNGVFGPDVASVAVQLDSQIADVVADLGNVYMGGNSPTDHALELAGKSLKGDWSEKVLHDMVKLAKGNVTIRQNSIRNVGVQGASANNPYAPPAPTSGAPDLAGLVPGHGRTFNAGPYAGQTWTLGPDGKPSQVK